MHAVKFVANLLAAAAWNLALSAAAAGAEIAAAPSADARTATLHKLRVTGVISVGYREGSPPFSYLDRTNRPIGFSIDLCSEVVTSLRRELRLPELRIKYVPVTPATRIPLVANGTLDLECGVTTNTVERQSSVAFSVTTFVAQARIASLRKSPVLTVDALRGKTVVSTVGTTSLRHLSALNETRRLGIEILAGRDDNDSFRLLGAGRAQAYVMDDVLLRSFVAQSTQPDSFVISDTVLTIEPYGLMLNKRDLEFKRLVDAALIALFRNGSYERIYRTWFLEPIPPNGVTLNLPMSDGLRRLLVEPTDSGDPQRYR